MSVKQPREDFRAIKEKMYEEVLRDAFAIHDQETVIRIVAVALTDLVVELKYGK